ncbi:MAG: class I SAM-dependent methyltransferase [Candidatus Thorarchaeota archaeon]
MTAVVYHSPIYKFLFSIDVFAKDMEKKILDCGAGGSKPPLSLFHDYGFETHGIEISMEQIKLAEEFANKKGQQLNIQKGDIRSLPYEDESFSYVISYNTIFHMNKNDMKKTIGEIRRVLKKGGFLFVNFMSIDDKFFGEGKEIGKGEFVLQDEKGEFTRYRSFLENNEINDYFEGFELLLHENRHIRLPTLWKNYEASYIDCLVRKI